jgi:hypothetical protein
MSRAGLKFPPSLIETSPMPSVDSLHPHDHLIQVARTYFSLGEATSARRVPNLFVVGVAKSGTTTLHSCLAQHPDIFMSKEKEPSFFATINPSLVLAMGHRVFDRVETYLDLFRDAGDQRWLGESSPSYIWEEDAAPRIARFSPDARIIILLREPVSRAYSSYLHLVRDQIEHRPFLQALQEDYASPAKGWGRSFHYVDLGFYCAPIRRFREHFPSDRVCILFFEELQADPPAFLAKLFSFLELDPASASQIRVDRKNPYMVPRNRVVAGLLRGMRDTGVWGPVRGMMPTPVREFLRDRVWFRESEKPAMNPEARRFLSDLYRGQIPELEELLGRKVPWDR